MYELDLFARTSDLISARSERVARGLSEELEWLSAGNLLKVCNDIRCKAKTGKHWSDCILLSLQWCQEPSAKVQSAPLCALTPIVKSDIKWVLRLQRRFSLRLFYQTSE